MTFPNQLDRLLKLRQQRTRLAEQALTRARQRCQEIDERSRRLIVEQNFHRQRADEHDDHLFETARQPLSAFHLEQWENSRADMDEFRADLEQQQQRCHDEASLAEQEREARAREWSRQLRAQKALERLQARHRQTALTNAEHLAELEMEESHSGGRFRQ